MNLNINSVSHQRLLFWGCVNNKAPLLIYLKCPSERAWLLRADHTDNDYVELGSGRRWEMLPERPLHRPQHPDIYVWVLLFDIQIAYRTQNGKQNERKWLIFLTLWSTAAGQKGSPELSSAAGRVLFKIIVNQPLGRTLSYYCVTDGRKSCWYQCQKINGVVRHSYSHLHWYRNRRNMIK